MPESRPVTRRLLVAGAIALAVGLAGCGRKGALEPPGDAWQAPEGNPTAKPPRDPVRPRDRLILDSLLN